MRSKVKISCLPVAGIANPYQFLMMEGLRTSTDYEVVNGVDDKFLGIIKTAYRQRPDVIHFDWETSYYYRKHMWMTMLSIPLFFLQLILARALFGCKFVWTPHNIVPHDAKHLALHRFARRFFARQMTWIRLFSSRSIIKASAELCIEREKFVICPEGSYVGFYENGVDVMEARTFLNLSSDDFTYLYLGFIKPYKGIENLIKAFEKLRLKNARLIIAGKAIDDDYFKRVYTTSPNIEFHNVFIDEELLQYYYNAADVVVLPFKKVENSGSAILAMSYGKTVIAPRVGVLEDRLVKQLDFLYLDDHGFLDCLKRAYNNKGFIKDIGHNNLLEVQKYKWEDFIGAFQLFLK